MNVRHVILALLPVSLLISPLVFCQEVPGFTAICKVLKSHRYDTGVTYAGDPMPKEWADNEKFFQDDWSFTYAAGGKILINGTEQSLGTHSTDLLIATQIDANIVAASFWTFMINLKLKEIVATQLNGSDIHLKGRLISFDCKFSFH